MSTGARRLGRLRRGPGVSDQLADIDRGLQNVERHVARLEERAAERQSYLDQHTAEAQRLRLLYRAELAREIQLRAEATISEEQPPDNVTYQLWRDATERAAVHEDRYPSGGDDGAGDWSYDRVVESFRAFADRAPREVSEAAPALEV